MPVKNIVTNQKVTAQKLQRAKELRREMTPAEKILWEELRGSKLGVRFRRQQVIQGFIVDFYCHPPLPSVPPPNPTWRLYTVGLVHVGRQYINEGMF